MDEYVCIAVCIYSSILDVVTAHYVLNATMH